MDDRARDTPRSLAGHVSASSAVWLCVLLLACTNAHEQGSTETDGATVAEGEGDTLSCQQRIEQARMQIAEAARGADRSCTGDADCVFSNASNVCHDACYAEVVSSTGEIELEGAVKAIEDGLCGTFTADGCRISPSGCPPLPERRLVCEAGRCTAREDPDCPECLGRDLWWGMVYLHTDVIPEDPNRYTIACKTFTAMNPNNSVCTRELMACWPDAPASGPVARDHAIDELQALLGDPDVEAALGPAGVEYQRSSATEPTFVISVDNVTIAIGPDCIAGEPCLEVPPGVAALRRVLEEIAEQQACLPDPRACPPNARFEEDVCLMCGPAGGCGATAATCALVCSSGEECAGSTIASSSCSPRGICEVTGCL